MNSWQTLFLFILAICVCVMAANSIRTGEVAWRGGAIAARRRDNPLFFWLLVVAQFAVAGVMLWRFAP